MDQFFKIAKKLGQSSIFVQGAGGNISVKIGEKMIVKASGYYLKDLKKNFGYVGCHWRPIKKYLAKKIKISLAQESAFDAFIRKNCLPKMNFGEPSIETGLHAVLPSRYVIHTHHVYANVFNCMKNGQVWLKKIFADQDFLLVPYYNPGLNLASRLNRLIKKYKRIPPIIFLANHGLVTHHQNGQRALQLTLMVNSRLEEYLRQQKFFQPFVIQERPAVFSQHLFPDSAVYSQIAANDLAGERKRIFYEISSASNYIIETISRLGQSPTFIATKNIDFICGMDKEKLRLKMIT